MFSGTSRKSWTGTHWQHRNRGRPRTYSNFTFEAINPFWLTVASLSVKTLEFRSCPLRFLRACAGSEMKKSSLGPPEVGWGIQHEVAE